MSTIVVVRKGNEAVIAADSLSTYGSTKLSAANDARPDKIVSVGQAHLGLVGSAAHYLVVKDLLGKHPDEYNFSSVEKIFDSFRRIHPILKKDYFLMTEEEDEQAYESSQIDALVASPQGIFGIHTLREVYEYRRYWATGSGWRYALGALHVLYENGGSAEEIAIGAVEAACEFDQGSGPPIRCVKTILEPPTVPVVPSAPVHP